MFWSTRCAEHLFAHGGGRPATRRESSHQEAQERQTAGLRDDADFRATAPPLGVQRDSRHCRRLKARFGARGEQWESEPAWVKVRSGFSSASTGIVINNMANKGQHPPYLHLAELTASQFLDIWNHFDTDGECRIQSYPKDRFPLRTSIFLSVCELNTAKLYV